MLSWTSYLIIAEISTISNMYASGNRPTVECHYHLIIIAFDPMSCTAVASEEFQNEFQNIVCILLLEITVLNAQVSPRGDTCLQVCALYKIELQTSVVTIIRKTGVDQTSEF